MSRPVKVPALIESSVSGKVVYSSIVSQKPFITQIFLKDLNSGEVTQLTHKESNFSPRWSPDGTQIVFTRSTEQNSNDIYLMNKDGTDQRALVATFANESLAAWAPNGKQIAFVSYEGDHAEIYKIDLTTQVITKLTESTDFSGLPAWSTSGNQIVFQSSSGGPGRSQIFILHADSKKIEKITDYDIDNFDGIPVWCPDDSCIIFSRHEGGVDKLILLELKSRETFSLLDGVFDANLRRGAIGRSPLSDTITFTVDGAFYAMNMKNSEIYKLDIDAIDLSLYP